MPVTVRKALEDDLYRVYQLLRSSTLNSAPLPFEARKRMFRPNWGGDEGYYGYVMEDGDEVVGFLGLLFTEREVKGKPHKFCELHSWYVKDEYRHEGMRLFLPVVSMRKVTLLNYTPTGTVYEIGKKFGFQDLEKRLVQFLPVPTWRSVAPGVRVERRKHAIVQRLDDADRRIFVAHDGVPCQHYLITSKKDDAYCYLIVKKMWFKKRIPFARIIYASNPDLLLRGIDRLKFTWMARLGAVFAVTDHDAVAAARTPLFARELPREFPSQFKSRDLTAEDIKPPLYTLPLLLGYRLH